MKPLRPNPHHNAHVHGIEITYPFHPQCGAEVVLLRRHKRWGQEMYGVLDVHGGHSGIPAWMTEPRWRGLQIASRPRVPRAVLNSLPRLLNIIIGHSISSERVVSVGSASEKLAVQ